MSRIEGEVHGAPLWYSAVWVGHRDEALLKAEDRGRTHVHVGGRHTKEGKTASVFSDAGGQRVFLSWFVPVLPLFSRVQK